MVTSVEFIGLKKTISYFNELSKTQIELQQLTKEQADEAKHFARDIAPVYTGALVSAIETRIGRKNEYTIISRTPSRNNPRRVPYQVYLHAGVRGNAGQRARKSGDHQYMDTTYEYLKKRYPDRVERALDRQINKK